jgi:hypothetical protein
LENNGLLFLVLVQNSIARSAKTAAPIKDKNPCWINRRLKSINSAITQKKTVNMSTALGVFVLRFIAFREIAPAVIDAEIIRSANVFRTVASAST